MIDSCYVHTYSYNADLMPAQREQRPPNLLKLKTYELAMTFFFFLFSFLFPFPSVLISNRKRQASREKGKYRDIPVLT